MSVSGSHGLAFVFEPIEISPSIFFCPAFEAEMLPDMAGKRALTDAHQAHFPSILLLFRGVELEAAGEIFG